MSQVIAVICTIFGFPRVTVLCRHDFVVGLGDYVFGLYDCVCVCMSVFKKN